MFFLTCKTGPPCRARAVPRRSVPRSVRHPERRLCQAPSKAVGNRAGSGEVRMLVNRGSVFDSWFSQALLRY